MPATAKISKPPIGHHVIPAYLLGQFASSDEKRKRSRDRKIWVYEKGMAPANRSIENECKENHYFSIQQSDGTRSTEYEVYANTEIEAPFNELLSSLDSPLYVPSYRHANIVYRYVANIFNRSKHRREASQITAEEIQQGCKKIAADPTRMRILTAAYSAALGQSVSVEEIAHRVANNGKNIARRNSRGDSFVLRIKELDARLIEMLQGRAYGILTAPTGSSFIIGDNPVITRMPQGETVITGVGFDKPNVHVLMPISSRICLQIGILGDFQREIRPDEILGINRDMMRLAHKKTYAQDYSPTIELEMNTFGCTRRYRKDAFVIPPLDEEKLFSALVQGALRMSDEYENGPATRDLWSKVAL